MAAISKRFYKNMENMRLYLEIVNLTFFNREIRLFVRTPLVQSISLASSSFSGTRSTQCQNRSVPSQDLKIRSENLIVLIWGFTYQHILEETLHELLGSKEVDKKMVTVS